MLESVFWNQCHITLDCVETMTVDAGSAVTPTIQRAALSRSRQWLAAVVTIWLGSTRPPAGECRCRSGVATTSAPSTQSGFACDALWISI